MPLKNGFLGSSDLAPLANHRIISITTSLSDQASIIDICARYTVNKITFQISDL